ncbi:CD276 antigen-like [Xyrichtys novacula]|uniref:CD276 antigen-like n=1 Tax=Xyrichtys novacula TaxID=13765 RepID=A0AAV1HIP5_XYRNO|nr:CD276 antigen-like [Xyrichtys novacula]
MWFPVMRGESQLIGSTETVVGLAGHHCVLPCSLKPATNVAEKTVEWTRSDLNPSYVHIFRQGRLLYDDVNPSFLQRTNLFEQELRNGNMSLKLSDLKISDTGMYTCKLITMSESFIQVSVVIGAVSEPQISLERYKDKLVFKCEARNWYPEPKMEWRDSEGRIIPHEDRIERGEYFSVYSRITVDIAASENYTCTVRQKDIRETREIVISPPEVFREVATMKISLSNLIGWLIVMVLLFLFALIMGALMLTWVETDGPIDPLMEQPERQNDNLQRQVELLQQQIDDLTEENGRLREEVQKLKRQIQDLREVDSDGDL